LLLIFFQDCNFKFSPSEPCGLHLEATFRDWPSAARYFSRMAACTSGDVPGEFPPLKSTHFVHSCASLYQRLGFGCNKKRGDECVSTNSQEFIAPEQVVRYAENQI
jgi:hypothetical protein